MLVNFSSFEIERSRNRTPPGALHTDKIAQ
jgi:hypothetical protein